LHKTFGASLRDLLGFVRSPEEYENLLIREIEKLDSTDLQGAIQNPRLHSLSHRLITVRPSHDSRGIPEKDFASQTVFGLLWDKYLKYQTAEMERFYNLFTGTPGTTVSAGWLFEARMHQSPGAQHGSPGKIIVKYFLKTFTIKSCYDFRD